jgi:serine/threonine-protein kinase
MGAVYRAEDLLLGRPVALKFLHKSEDAERLLREAKAACAVTHPNVCLVYEVDPAHGFIAMEFVDGVTLDKQLGGRPLPAEEAIDLALQLCEGLRAAHEVRVIHRDLKSANVMVTRAKRAKLMDFGLARLMTGTRHTEQGLIAGTPGYMAPEQCAGREVDFRTDIWAFGMLLHEMLTGQRAAGKHVRRLPAGLDRIVAKAIEENPANRYQHVDDLIVDLRSWKGGGTGNRRRALWAATAAVLSLLAGGAAWWLYTPVPPIDSLAVLPIVNDTADGSSD